MFASVGSTSSKISEKEISPTSAVVSPCSLGREYSIKGEPGAVCKAAMVASSGASSGSNPRRSGDICGIDEAWYVETTEDTEDADATDAVEEAEDANGAEEAEDAEDTGGAEEANGAKGAEDANGAEGGGDCESTEGPEAVGAAEDPRDVETAETAGVFAGMA